jgi:phosphatidylglycerol:prolipoprotein diacylglycerol transferase
LRQVAAFLSRSANPWRILSCSAFGNCGVPIHPTQLYSILSNVMPGALLLRLWSWHCPLSVIGGVYGLGSGFARFAEEAYRGEPQTRIVWDLRLYQWLAALSVVSGAALTTMAWPPAQGFTLTRAGCAWAAIYALAAGVALSVDFPGNDRPFARLT